MNEHKAYLATLDLVHALWWFIENCDALDMSENDRCELFFYLRERVRDGK